MLAVKISNLVKSYGQGESKKEILHGLNLEIKKGEFIGILGPNGAGKTTTINCITGITDPTSGDVKVFGHDVVSEYRQARSRVGLSPQEFVIDMFNSVYDILYYQAGYFSIVGDERKARIQEMLDIFELNEHKDKQFRFLSGGLKRRGVVAKALIHNPDLIVLDEPTAGVDVETRQDLWKYLRKLHSSGKTIILTSHYLEEVQALCDRVVVVRSGNIIYDKSMSEATASGNLEELYLELVTTEGSKK